MAAHLPLRRSNALSHKPIDLGRVRASRARLDALADAYPELTTQKPSASREADWVGILEDEMAKTTAELQADYRARRRAAGEKQMQVYLPPDVVKVIDGWIAAKPMSRNEAIVAALRHLAGSKWAPE